MSYVEILKINVNSGVNSIALIPEGRSRVVAVTISGGIFLWNAATGELLKHDDREDAQSALRSVAWSPDGKHIASSSSDGNIQIWDSTNLNLISTLPSESIYDIIDVSWSPDNIHIVSGSYTGQVNIWNTETGENERTLGEETDEMDNAEHTSLILSVAWSPDGKKIISSSDDGIVHLWNAETGELEQGLVSPSQVTSISFNHDGSQYVTGETRGILRIPNKNILMKGHTRGITSTDWSADGRYIVSGSVDKTVRVWDAVKGQSLAVLRGHDDTVTSVVISPNGDYIMSGSLDRTVRVWANNKVIAARSTLKRNLSTMRGLAYRPEGALSPTDPGGHKFSKIVDNLNFDTFKIKVDGGRRKKKNTRKRNKKRKMKNTRKK